MLLDQAIAAPILTFTFLFLLFIFKNAANVMAAIEHTKQIILPILFNNYKVLDILNLKILYVL